MKRSLKIVTIAIAFLYCFAIGVVSMSFIPGNLLVKSRTENTVLISTASINLFNYQNQKENRVNGQVYFQIKDFKEPLGQLNPYSRILSQLFKSEISQYSRFTQQLQIQKKISILIFPFNYFW